MTAMDEIYGAYFIAYLDHGIQSNRLDAKLKTFDLNKIIHAIKPERSQQFTYLGLQTLYDRYFIHSNYIRFELPQAFFMRVAMGLALTEVDSMREQRAIEFYDLLSTFDFMTSTPTLFNAGTKRPQLASSFLTTVPDDLHGIFAAVKDNALLSKYAGGLGNDWSNVRALDSHIDGTNGKSLGVIPYLKVVDASISAVNQGGKRKAAVCAYLESWHLDIENFLALRKNDGDVRYQIYDLNTVNWLPDLFLQRVFEDKHWTLFSPDETPELHDLYGSKFKAAYEKYEAKAQAGEMNQFKTIRAVALLICLLIIFILAFAAVPNFSSNLSKQRAISQYNSFITLLRFARHFAITSGNKITVCALQKSGICSTKWRHRLTVFHKHPNGNIKLLKVMSLLSAVNLNWNGNSPRIQFGADGTLLSGPGKFSFIFSSCPQNCAAVVILSSTGRIRKET